MSTIIGRVIPFPKDGMESPKGFMNPPVEAAGPEKAEKTPTKRRGRGAKSETR